MQAIVNTISRFANSFDTKDWAGLESVLADPVEVDYSDLRGEVGSVACADYVAQRRDALQALDTHHTLSNHEITVDGALATCRVSGLIQRRNGERFFHSYVIYDFALKQRDGAWCICFVRQRVLWNEGDPDLHAGATGA